MSIKENKAIVRSFFESIEGKEEMQRQIQAADDPASELEKVIRFGSTQVYTPDYVEHGPRSDMPFEELIKFTVSLITAFPDLAYKVGDIFAEGDKVVVRYSARGTHLGTYLDVPPSGKKIEINGIYIVRMADGKIAEGWFVSSFFSLKEQIEQVRLSLLKKN